MQLRPPPPIGLLLARDPPAGDDERTLEAIARAHDRHPDAHRAMLGTRDEAIEHRARQRREEVAEPDMPRVEARFDRARELFAAVGGVIFVQRAPRLRIGRGVDRGVGGRADIEAG